MKIVSSDVWVPWVMFVNQEISWRDYAQLLVQFSDVVTEHKGSPEVELVWMKQVLASHENDVVAKGNKICCY